MIFTQTSLEGAYLIEPEMLEDERGFFARTFCTEEFEAHGLDMRIAQCNLSCNRLKGTLRGMHYQVSPRAETKLVRCTHGGIFDAIIDLRESSSTYREWFGIKMTAGNHLMLYVPEGFAHGFQTLEDNTVVFYQMSEYYSPECARGVRWDDPAFGIRWPVPVTNVSTEDLAFPRIESRGTQ